MTTSPITHRLAHGLFRWLLVPAAAAVLVTVWLLSSPSASAQGTRAVGEVPVADIITAANASARLDCGLTGDRLAAMMLAPVFHETGAVWSRTTSPSPMTMSRWDNQSGLYAFGDRSTAYRRAFWHPGVGMWQFDSAGGWNLTAAGAVSTQSSASTAASVMASRYCAASGDPVTRMKYAWSLWYACVSGSTNVCVDRFNEMYVGGVFTNITRDPRVGRLGGMIATTCRIGGVTEVACHRIDPARAEGWNAWAAENAGPTPLSAAFYVFALNDIEYRYWLAVDTGYDATIVARKPVRANARSSLTWEKVTGSTLLCDLGFGRGDCGPKRVATTPWGNKVELPFGSLDTTTSGANAVTAAGWAIDPDTTGPIDVHVYVDGTWGGSARADRTRTDVGRAVPGYGDAHGYSLRIANLPAGERTVCAFGINKGPYGDTNPQLGCRTVTVSASPVGNLEAARLAPGGVQVIGWLADPDSAEAVDLEVSVDGAPVATAEAVLTRADVARSYPAFGASRGFSVTVAVPTSPGARQVCVTSTDLPTGDRVQLGCVAVAIPSSPVVGSVDALDALDGSIRARGWALRWTSADPVALTFTVDGVVAGTGTASGTRTDVAKVWPGFDARRGFDVTLPARLGPHSVCAVAGTTTVACRTVTVTSGDYADVDLTSWYIEPVRWSADTALTSGFPNAWSFSPDARLSRSQLVMFLWRYFGSPSAPTACGWGDVPSTASFAGAACWARSAGVVRGVGGDPARFDPAGGVTRAQMAAMLWRATGEKAPTQPNGFVDVPAGGWFDAPTAWMAEHGVSGGLAGSGTVYGPDGPVTRAQMVTVLWRLAAAPGAWAVAQPATATR